MKCAIATVAIGENHRSAYAAVFRPSVERYAMRHGHDLVVFEDSLSREPDRRDLAMFEKLRVPFDERVAGFDRVMVLDVDVIVSARAPPLDSLDLRGRIGIVDEWCQPSEAGHRAFQELNGLPVSASDYHALAGFTIDTGRVLNSGMFVFSPAQHGPLFRELVAVHAEAHRNHPRGPHYEQSMLSYELQRRGLAELVPTAWNCLWPLHRRSPRWGPPDPGLGAAERWADLRHFRGVVDANFFVHMAGGLDHDLAYLSRHR
ncbi:MAG: hypothetical protein KIS68_09445 [Bauldia sp.]|nr:hypothetical protein [Bauldia sp.]